MDKIAAVPGVASVALASTVTMSGQGWHDPLYAQDRTYSESADPADSSVQVRLARLHEDDGWHRWSRAAISHGPTRTSCGRWRWCRKISRASCGASQSAAIGKRVRPYAKGVWREVVGVVSDMRDDGLNRKAPAVAYWPLLMADFFAADAGQPPFRAARRLVRDSQQPDRIQRVRQRAGAGGVVDQPQSAAGQRPNAAGRSTTRRWRGRRLRW